MWRSRIAGASPAFLLVVLAAVLATYNLEYYPVTWFDEGSHLHVPKTLVQYGQYADLSAEGLRFDGPVFGVGPTVLAPIALSFYVAGVGLLQARLVMVFYLVACLSMYYAVADRLYGRLVAALAAVLVLTSPGVAFVETGRQVLGEVPALFFLLLGTYLWLAALDTGSRWKLVASGAGFGLAVVTKSQYLVLILPALLFTPMVAGAGTLRSRLPQAVLPLLVALSAYGGWYLFYILVLAPVDATANLAALRLGSEGALFSFSPRRTGSALRLLASPEVYYGWTLPALVYAGISVNSLRDSRTHGQGLILLASGFGLAWFVFASVGWPRYALAPLSLAGIFVAKLLADLCHGLLSSLRKARLDHVTAVRARAFAVALAVTLMVGYSAFEVLRPMTIVDDTPQAFARFLDQNVDTTAVIETWEPELGFLTNHRYHYPPPSVLYKAVKQKWGDGSADFGYDPRGVQPDYVILGAFGKWTNLYAPYLAESKNEKVASVGYYDLYRLEKLIDVASP